MINSPSIISVRAPLIVYNPQFNINQQLLSNRQHWNMPIHSRGQTQEKKSQDNFKQISQPQSNITDYKQLIIVQQPSQTVQSNKFGKKHQNLLKDVVSQIDKPSNKNNHGIQDFTQQLKNNKDKNNQITKQKKYYIDDLIAAFQNENLNDAKIFRENFVTAFNFIPSLNQLDFDKEEIEIKKINLHDYPKNIKYKKTIVFDLDETLVHCNDDDQIQSHIVLPITFPTGDTINAGINIRPFAKKLIENLCELCEVMIFTASHECYANEVINYLDPENKVAKRIFRDSCIMVGQQYYIKNLEVIGRDLKSLVLVDNASYSFVHHLENGIPIISYYDSKSDTQLIQLFRFIKEKILPAEDVRPIIREHFKLDQIGQFQSVVEALENMYCIE